MKKGERNNINDLYYPEVRPLLDKNKKVIVHVEPNRVAMIVGLFFTLIVLFIFLVIQMSGYSIAIGSMFVLCALAFVITYGIAGILTYYSLWLLKTMQSADIEVEEIKEEKEEKTQK